MKERKIVDLINALTSAVQRVFIDSTSWFENFNCVKMLCVNWWGVELKCKNRLITCGKMLR